MEEYLFMVSRKMEELLGKDSSTWNMRESKGMERGKQSEPKTLGSGAF